MEEGTGVRMIFTPQREDADLVAENQIMRNRIAFLEAHIAALSTPRANLERAPGSHNPPRPDL